VFDSWGIETPISYTKDEINAIMQQLATEKYGIILRSKGVVKAKDGDNWYHFDYVAGDYEVREGSADVIGKLCVIGSQIDKQAISDLFLRR
jgi:G3E family GTPase